MRLLGTTAKNGFCLCLRDTYDETYMETTAEKKCIFNTFLSPGWTRGPKMQRGLPKVRSVYLWFFRSPFQKRLTLYIFVHSRVVANVEMAEI